MRFPLSYRIKGNPGTAFAEHGDYFLQAEVFSGAGDELVVGDLVSENFTPVVSDLFTVPNLEAVEIKVTGLEACGSLESGGFCL